MWLHKWIYLILLLLGVVTGAEIEKLGESGGPNRGPAQRSTDNSPENTPIDISTTIDLGAGGTAQVTTEPAVPGGQGVKNDSTSAEAGLAAMGEGTMNDKSDESSNLVLNEDSTQDAKEDKDKDKDAAKDEEESTEQGVGEEEPSLDEIKAMKAPSGKATNAGEKAANNLKLEKAAEKVNAQAAAQLKLNGPIAPCCPPDFSGKVPAHLKMNHDGLPFDWPGNPKPAKCKNGDVYPGSAGCQPMSNGPLPLAGRDAYQGTATVCPPPEESDSPCMKKPCRDPCEQLSDKNQVQAGRIPTLMLSCCDGQAKGCENAACRSEIKEKYQGAVYSWSFQKSLNISGRYMVQDIISNRVAILHNGANIATTEERGSHLVLYKSNIKKYGANHYPWVGLGDFRGTCVSDPDACKKGITILFWIRLTSEMIKKQKGRGFKTQYILSSGAQNKRSRGFAYYYQDKDDWKGLKFIAQTRHKTYTLPMDELPEQWIFVTFTWTKEDGVTYYQNGKKMYHGMSTASKRTTDIQTSFTLAKPNDQDANFGRFKMDDFTVYYKALSDSDVKKVFKGSGIANKVFHDVDKENNIKKNNDESDREARSLVRRKARRRAVINRTGSKRSGIASAAGGKRKSSIDKYSGAEVCWLFETITDGKYVFDAFGNQKATLHNGATLSQYDAGGFYLSLTHANTKKHGDGAYPWVELGNFKGTCGGDPDLCNKGITVMFWLHMTVEMTTKQIKRGFNTQYVLAGGSQNGQRGFAFWYQDSDSYNGCRFRIRTKSKEYVQDIKSIPQTWFFVTFRWRLEGDDGLFYFRDGDKIGGPGNESSGTFKTNENPIMTLGRTIDESSNYGRFRIDELTLFYKYLSAKEIKSIYDKGASEGLGVGSSSAKLLSSTSGVYLRNMTNAGDGGSSEASSSPKEGEASKKDDKDEKESSHAEGDKDKSHSEKESSKGEKSASKAEGSSSSPEKETSHAEKEKEAAPAEKEASHTEKEESHTEKEVSHIEKSTEEKESSHAEGGSSHGESHDDGAHSSESKQAEGSHSSGGKETEKSVKSEDSKSAAPPKASEENKESKENKVTEQSSNKKTDDKGTSVENKENPLIGLSSLGGTVTPIAGTIGGETSSSCKNESGGECRDTSSATTNTGGQEAGSDAAKKKFSGAAYCWLFDEQDDPTYTYDIIKGKKATMHNGAAIEEAGKRGSHLTLSRANPSKYGENNYPWVDMGDYGGECISDPVTCSNGISVTFWLHMTTEMTEKQLQKNMKHQYILSSGGQKSDSRGFAFLYQNDNVFEGYKLQLQSSIMDYVIELKSIPQTWFFVCYTWSASKGLIYYQDDARIAAEGTAVPGEYSTDLQTHLTVGKPNYGEKYYGRFKMDELAIYFKALSKSEIVNLYEGKPIDTNEGGSESSSIAPSNSEVKGSSTIGPSAVIKDFRGHGLAGSNDIADTVGHGSSDIVDKQDAGGAKANGDKEGSNKKEDGSSSEGSSFVDNVSTVGTVKGSSIQSGESNHTGHVVPVVAIGAITEAGVLDNNKKNKKDKDAERVKKEKEKEDTEGAIVPGVRVGHLGGTGGLSKNSESLSAIVEPKKYSEKESEDCIDKVTGTKRVGCLIATDLEDVSKVGGQSEDAQEERFGDLSTGGIVTTGGNVIKADRGIKKKGSSMFGSLGKVGGSGGIGKVGGERISTNIITDVVRPAPVAPLVPAVAPGVTATGPPPVANPENAGNVNNNNAGNNNAGGAEGQNQKAPGVENGPAKKKPGQGGENAGNIANPNGPNGGKAKANHGIVESVDPHLNNKNNGFFPAKNKAGGRYLNASITGRCTICAPSDPRDPSPREKEERCILKADIVLLVDGSASISAFGTTATGDPNFYKNHIFKFLENIINKFDVSPEGTHIGVVFFGKKNMEEVKNKGWNFGLDQMYNANEMIKFFENKDKGPMFGATYTGAGFREAQAVLEKSKRRNKKVARAILLLTDGAPTDPEVADKVVEELKKNHVSVVTLGIGNDIDQDALKRYASKENYFVRTDFVDMKENPLTMVSASICQAIKEDSPTETEVDAVSVNYIPPAIAPETDGSPEPITQGVCSIKMDVVLIIDNSGSIETRGGEGYFDQIKMFIKNIMKLFDVGNNVNVGIIEAATDARLIAKMGDVKDHQALDVIINNMNYKRGRSFLGKALEFARLDIFSKVQCQTSTKVMLTITDGYASDIVTPIGSELRDMGVIMLAIGYGTETPLMRFNLESIASEPKEQFTFIIPYDQLIEKTQQIVKKACTAALRVSITGHDLSGDPVVQQPLGGDVILLFMNEINSYRRMHSALPLTLSTSLTLKAQQWAEHLAEMDKGMIPKPRVHYGQTLYISSEGALAVQIAVRAWYNQIIYYDFQRPEVTKYNSYFVQLVWRSTTDVGIGQYLSASGKSYVVAFYTPIGNSDHDLGFNILPITSSAVTGVQAGYCPPEFQTTALYCYKVYSDPLSWEDAVTTCSGQKASLMSITTLDEYYYMFTILHSHNMQTSWLGLNDRLVKGSYSWVDGAPLSFNGWTNSPMQDVNNNCVFISPLNGWEASACSATNPFICKMIRPTIINFMVTIHYPSIPWSPYFTQPMSSQTADLTDKISLLIKSIYSTLDWFYGFHVKAIRGHVSVFIDVELQFTPFAPIDPIGPLKNVTYSEDCQGTICDLSDVQIIPAMNISYKEQCTASCYTHCASTCPPACCSPQSQYSSSLATEVSEMMIPYKGDPKPGQTSVEITPTSVVVMPSAEAAATAGYHEGTPIDASYGVTSSVTIPGAAGAAATSTEHAVSAGVPGLMLSATQPATDHASIIAMAQNDADSFMHKTTGLPIIANCVEGICRSDTRAANLKKQEEAPPPPPRPPPQKENQQGPPIPASSLIASGATPLTVLPAYSNTHEISKAPGLSPPPGIPADSRTQQPQPTATAPAPVPPPAPPPRPPPAIAPASPPPEPPPEPQLDASALSAPPAPQAPQPPQVPPPPSQQAVPQRAPPAPPPPQAPAAPGKPLPAQAVTTAPAAKQQRPKPVTASKNTSSHIERNLYAGQAYSGASSLHRRLQIKETAPAGYNRGTEAKAQPASAKAQPAAPKIQPTTSKASPASAKSPSAGAKSQTVSGKSKPAPAKKAETRAPATKPAIHLTKAEPVATGKNKVPAYHTQQPRAKAQTSTAKRAQPAATARSPPANTSSKKSPISTKTQPSSTKPQAVVTKKAQTKTLTIRLKVPVGVEIKSQTLSAKTQPVSAQTLSAKQAISAKTLQPATTKVRALSAKKSQPPKAPPVSAKGPAMSIKTPSATTKTRGKIANIKHNAGSGGVKRAQSRTPTISKVQNARGKNRAIIVYETSGKNITRRTLKPLAEPGVDIIDDDFPRSIPDHKNRPLGTLVSRGQLVSPATVRPIKIKPQQNLERDQYSCLPSCRQYCTMQCPTQCCAYTLRNKALKLTPLVHTRARPILQKSQILQKQQLLHNSRVYTNPFRIPRWAFQNPNPFKLWSNETLKATRY